MLDARIEKGRIAAIYRKIAPSYDLWAWLTESRARDRCLDLTEAMLERAERKAAKSGSNNYRLRVGDAYSLDFPDDTFDVVISIRNYLRKNGRQLTAVARSGNCRFMPRMRECRSRSN